MPLRDINWKVRETLMQQASIGLTQLTSRNVWESSNRNDWSSTVPRDARWRSRSQATQQRTWQHFTRTHVHSVIAVTTLQSEKTPQYFQMIRRQYVEQTHNFRSKYSVNNTMEKWITVQIKYRQIILLSCHNKISLTTQIPWPFPDFGPFSWLSPNLSRILWHFQVSRKVVTLGLSLLPHTNHPLHSYMQNHRYRC